jgi:uncharacterized tellurite resistance protein B-like protein
MISRITAFLDKITHASQDSKEVLSASELQIATAALLIEVASIDQHIDDAELEALRQTLSQRFSLSSDEMNALVQHAKTASNEAASLYQFTQLINRHCDDSEKYDLACGLWEVAYADKVLDKHEEHIIRRIADLIHLRHIDFIRAKHHVRDKT